MNKRTFEVTNNKFFNFAGRNIYKGYSINLKPMKQKEREITGYGVSKSSEEIDRLEKNPMNKLQQKLSKLELRF